MLKDLKNTLFTLQFLGIALWAFIATLVICAVHTYILGDTYSRFEVGVFAILTGLFAGVAVKHQLFGLLCGSVFLSGHTILAIETKRSGWTWVGVSDDNLVANIITFTLLATPAVVWLIDQTRKKPA